MNKVIILLISVLFINAVASTLSPSKNKKGKQQKDKELIIKTGPVEKNVYERELVIEEPTGNSIVIESGTYFKETGLKNFNGTVLGYVTPVSLKFQFRTEAGNYIFLSHFILVE